MAAAAAAVAAAAAAAAAAAGGGGAGGAAAAGAQHNDDDDVAHVIDLSVADQRRELIQRVRDAASYYDVLGVAPDATPQDITRAYRRVILVVHPDKTSEEGAEAAFMRAHEAFMCLSNERMRGQYNAAGAGDPDAFRAAHEQHAASMRETVLQYMNALDGVGIRLPPEEYRDDFAHFVEEMAESGRLQETFRRWSLRSTAALVVAGVVMPVSLPVFALVVALGPLVVGPAIAWEEVLDDFEDQGRAPDAATRRDFMRATASIASSSVRLALVWSLTLAGAAVVVPVHVAQYAARQLFATKIEAIEAWEIADIDPDGSTVFYSIDAHGTVSGPEVIAPDVESHANTSTQPDAAAHDIVFSIELAERSSRAAAAPANLLDSMDAPAGTGAGEDDAQPWTFVDVVPLPLPPSSASASAGIVLPELVQASSSARAAADAIAW